MTDQLTAEQVNRRIRSSLSRPVVEVLDPTPLDWGEQPEGTQPGDSRTEAEHPTAPSDPITSEAAALLGSTTAAVGRGLRRRLNTFVVERQLPRLNLTSHKNLRRTQERLREADEDRERLTIALARATASAERNAQDVADLLIQRASLNADLTTAIEQREKGLAERDNLLEQRTVLIDERNQLLAELASVAADRSRLQHQLALVTMASQTEGNTLAQLRSVVAPLEAAVAEMRRQLIKTTSRGTPFATVGVDSHVASAEAIRTALLKGSGRQKVRRLLTELYGDEADPNLRALWEQYDLADAGRPSYWDVRTALRVLAERLKPRTYLEIGTRRGWSLAQVFAECPDVTAYIFEVWEQDYGGTEQGSPEYVTAKMQAVVGPQRSPALHFVSGNSHDTLPEFLALREHDHPGTVPTFDLITVDGDHSRLGAWWDLCDLFPHVALGGALVFDDLEYIGDEDGRPGFAPPTSIRPRPPVPPMMRSLEDVWLEMQMRQPNFAFLASSELKYRAGIALRVA